MCLRRSHCAVGKKRKKNQSRQGKAKEAEQLLLNWLSEGHTLSSQKPHAMQVQRRRPKSRLNRFMSQRVWFMSQRVWWHGRQSWQLWKASVELTCLLAFDHMRSVFSNVPRHLDALRSRPHGRWAPDRNDPENPAGDFGLALKTLLRHSWQHDFEVP